MDSVARKAAAAACKKRDVVVGIYALRCAASGQIWVGQSRNMAAQQNQMAFSLRNGGFLSRTLQAVWAAQGADGLSYDVLECLQEPEEGLPAFARQKWLVERERFWREKLGAEPL